MAKAPAPSDLDLSTGDMKQMLNKATRQAPYSIAFGVTKEKAAMLTLHKNRAPKKLADDLGDAHKELKDPRGGFAFVDEAEGSTIKIRVKRLPTGMGRPLVKALKGTGFNDVLFLLDDDSDLTNKANDKVLGGSKNETDDDGAPAAAAAAPPPPAPPPPAPPAQPKYDVVELQKQLGLLIPRIAPAGGTNIELLAQLKKYATDANVNIKTNNLNTAAAALKLLSDAIDAAPPPTAPGTNGAPADFAKSRDIWVAARSRITADIEKLRAELVATYQAEGIAADVEKRYQEKVAPLLTTLDASLADKLAEANAATDPAARTKLVGEARAIMARYATALANPVLADLDKNPFVPLSIQTTLSTTLKGLATTIH